MSGKRLEYIFWGIVLFVLGIFFAGLGLSFISLITNELYGWFGKTIFVIIGIAILGVAYGIMRLSLFSFAGKSNWFLILYRDSVLYKYRDNKDENEFVEIKMPFNAVQKCHILRKRVKRLTYLKYKRIELVEYHLSVHLEYVDDGEQDYIHLTLPDGFNELNTLISFLQNEQGIPVYFNIAEPEGYEELKEEEALKIAESKEVDFTGDLKDYDKKDYRVR